MNKEEWLERYKQAFVDNADLDAEEAQECVDAADKDTVMLHFENDPEGAALEEMSYWEPTVGPQHGAK